MIALNETDEGAAEVPFFLPDNSNLPFGLTGHTFTLGEVQIRLPGGSWINATLAKIREVGFGQYAVRLTSSQTTVAGTVYVRAIVTGAQPYFGNEVISDQGGEITVLGDGFIPFFLPNHDDPVNGSPITGHVFSAGEVKIALPDVSFANANTSKIFEIGFGGYALALNSADGDTTTRGKAYVYANIGGTSQPFLGYVTILGLGFAPVVPPTPPAPVVVPVTIAVSTAGSVSVEDHSAIGVTRLLEQHRFPAVN